MKRNSRLTQRGSSFIETMISVTILSILGGGMFTIMMDSDGMFRSSLQSSRVRQQTLEVFDLLKEELGQAHPDTLLIDTDNVFGDSLSFQIPVDVTGGVVTWGARVAADETGQNWNSLADHFVTFLVVAENNNTSFRLIRRVVDENGIPVIPDETIATEVDAPTEAGKGFVIEQTGNLITATLRLRVTNSSVVDDGINPHGEDVFRTHRTVIRLRTNS